MGVRKPLNIHTDIQNVRKKIIDMEFHTESYIVFCLLVSIVQRSLCKCCIESLDGLDIQGRSVI